jgi:metallo-beta-lactamase class B
MNITPGHTLGTITPTFEVKSGGQTHRVLLWGGTAFNFGKNLPRLESYIAATQRMAKLAQAQQIDVMLSNHAGYDDTVRKLEALRKQAAPNPFVIGTAAVTRALGAMGECAQAQRDRFLLAP